MLISSKEKPLSRGSLLVDGIIPARTDCPFRWRCEIADAGQCKLSGPLHRADFSCAIARSFDLTASDEELAKVPLTFQVSGDEHTHGWFFNFSAEIDESNFLQACKMAISAAKRACRAGETCNVTFSASGVDVVMSDSSDAQTQFDVWKTVRAQQTAIDRGRSSEPR